MHVRDLDVRRLVARVGYLRRREVRERWYCQEYMGLRPDPPEKVEERLEQDIRAEVWESEAEMDEMFSYV